MIEHNTLVKPCKTREGYEVRLINELGQTLFKLKFNDHENAKDYYESNKAKADWTKEVHDYAKANNVLATVPYKFFYKDKFGQMGSKVVEVSQKDCELAIAKFEKENPEIIWRSFTAL